MTRYFSLLILLAFSLNLHAITITWNGSVDNLWSNPSNWTPAQLPSTTDDVVINPGFTVNVPVSYNAFSGSLTVTSSTLEILTDGSLFINDLLVPSTGFSNLFQNTILINAGSVLVTGAFMAVTNSTITNNGLIFVSGSVNNALYNFYFDSGTTVTNNFNHRLQSRFNLAPDGIRKTAFMKITNGASVTNYGEVFNSYTANDDDFLKKGIVMDTGAEFKNLTGFINLNWIQDVGIEISNITNNVPKTIFQNDAETRIREVTANMNPSSYGMIVNPNSAFSGAALLLTVGGSGPNGFNDVTPQVDMQGCIIFNSIPAAPFNPGNVIFQPGSVVSGNGPFNNTAAIFNNARLSPGSSPGIITFTDDYSGSSTFFMEWAGLGGAGTPTGYDQIIFDGISNDISNTVLELELIDGFVPSMGDKFEVVTGLYNGTFSGLNLPGQPNAWQVNYESDFIELELMEAINLNFNTDNVGVGTSTPEAKMHIKDGDIYLETIGSGVIIKDANGNCYRITVSTSGVLSTEALSVCP